MGGVGEEGYKREGGLMNMQRGVRPTQERGSLGFIGERERACVMLGLTSIMDE